MIGKNDVLRAARQVAIGQMPLVYLSGPSAWESSVWREAQELLAISSVIRRRARENVAGEEGYDG